MIGYGSEGERSSLHGLDPARPGINELITNWAIHGGYSTSGLAARDVVNVLNERGWTDVEPVNANAMPRDFKSGINDGLTGVIRFTNEVDLKTARPSFAFALTAKHDLS